MNAAFTDQQVIGHSGDMFKPFPSSPLLEDVNVLMFCCLVESAIGDGPRPGPLKQVLWNLACLLVSWHYLAVSCAHTPSHRGTWRQHCSGRF